MERARTEQQYAMIDPTAMQDTRLLNLQQQGDRGLSMLRLVLQQLCLNSMADTAVVCRLMCCSRATTALVHQECAGALTLQYPGEEGYTPGYSPTLLCTWLAKHAALLRVLQLDGRIPTEDREYAAAGLRAAAGVPSMCNVAAATSNRPDDRKARFLVAAEAAAQEALLMQSAVPPQQHGRSSLEEPEQPAGVSMLPLQELHFDGLLGGTFMPTISACCRQLIRLDLSSFFYESPPSDLKALHNLQQLSVNCDEVWTEASLRSISGLIKPTKLDAPGLLLCSIQHLRTSLVEVCARGLGESHWLDVQSSTCVMDLRRMTSLTSLQLGTVQDPQLLPAQLKELHVENFRWDEGYVQLPQLQTLQITGHKDNHKPDLVALMALTQLTALKLCIHPYVEGRREKVLSMSGVCKHLPKLPLVQLQLAGMHVFKEDFEHSGRCTQLTELSLDRVCLYIGVGACAEQLLQLQGLKRLRLNDVDLNPHPREPSALQPLVDAVCQLCLGPLCFVELFDLVPSEQQLLALQGFLGSSLAYREGRLMSDSSSADFETESYEYDSSSSGEDYDSPSSGEDSDESV